MTVPHIPLSQSYSSQLAFRKRLFWSLLALLIVLAIFFWTGSRYPALNEKALMGGETNIGALGFDILIVTDEQSSLLLQMFATSINWMYTNWRGMAFGLAFGTILMSLIPLVRDLQLKSPRANAFIGMIIGAPLGVCANCAAPIAKGMLMSGARSETALAALLSSPSFNVIVLTIAIALLPLHLVLLKIGLTLVAVLLLVPLVCRFAPMPANAPDAQPVIEGDSNDYEQRGRNFFLVIATILVKNGWDLVRKTVPLMIAAGFLGGIAVTLLPLDQLVDILPDPERKMFWIVFPLIALLGLFLPVPIAFDVIIVAILIQAGLHPAYAAILLLTLGVFSIYPYGLLRAGGAARTANFLSAGLLALAVIGGAFAYFQNASLEEKQEQALKALVASRTEPFPADPSTLRQAGAAASEIATRIAGSRLGWTSQGSIGEIEISSRAFSSPSLTSDKAGLQFDISDAQAFGIEEPLNYLPEKLIMRTTESRSMAAGDFNGDGWPDIVFSSHDGIGLYVNQGGKRFIAQELDLGLGAWTYISSVAFVDMNNDNALDLVFSTLDGDLMLALNDAGDFSKDRLTRLPVQTREAIPNTLGFADLDSNSEMDIYVGNLSFTNNRERWSFASSRNHILAQSGGKFDLRILPEVPAETLTVLLTDLDDDGLTDIYVGNDFFPSDVVYKNKGRLDFTRQTEPDALFAVGPTTTMSASSGDIDNDLAPEIFVVQKAFTGEFNDISNQEVCLEQQDAEERAACLKVAGLNDVSRLASVERNPEQCDALTDEVERHACISLFFNAIAHREKAPQYCEPFAKSWPLIARDCRSLFADTGPIDEGLLNSQMPSEIRRNFLYRLGANGRYTDDASTVGVDQTAWGWNAKFADLDQDGWLDVLVATGEFETSKNNPLYLMRNDRSGKMENVTKQAGITTYQSFAAYSYLDFDNDGDLDMILVPQLGSPKVYRNVSQSGEAVIVELVDYGGNRRGIGSRVTIEYGDGSKQMREIFASGGYMSFDPPEAHFGTGSATSIDRITVRWSTGETDVLKGPFPSGRRYRLTRNAD